MMIMMVAELGSKGPIDRESGVRPVTNGACLINSLPVNY